MEKLLSFTRDNYILFTVITVILLLALVGYLSQKVVNNGKAAFRIRKDVDIDSVNKKEKKKGKK